MVSKNNKKLIAEKNRRNEKQRFAIRKLNIGVASVLLGITFSIYGGGQAVAHADTANASDQVAASNTDDNSLTDKSAVTLSSTATNASQSSTSATSANSAAQSQASANSQPAAIASNNAPASTAAVEATKDQSTSENQSSTSQEVQTPAPAQPVGQENSSKDANASASLDATRQVLNTITNRNSMPVANYLTSFAAVPASDSVETTTLNSFTNQETNANALAESKVAATALAAEAEDPNTKTVTNAKEFIDAIQNGTYTTINVANDINLASEYDGTYRQRVISHKRDILIQSATPGVKHTIDFSGNSFSMNTQNSVTFKDLDLYERSYWGIVYNAGGYVFDNVNFAGSQLIYTESSINSTLTFKNNVTATAVGTYTGPLDEKSRPSQGGNTQQILQFVGGTNHIIFDENSNVTLTTTNSNVLEIDGGTATIDVKNGANVTINPHSKGNPENRNGIGTGSIARAIASNANTTINVDKGANLTINTEKASGDSDVAGALYLNSDATLNVNGDLNINSTGTPSTKNDGYPVYIAGNAAINVGNGGKFNLSATNTGSYNDNLMSISGKGTVKLAPHSNFKISADGTGALTAINLSSGSTFTSDQPDAFTIDLSANTSTGKSLIKNGTIHFTRVKTVTDGNESQPLGKIDVTYDRNGNATDYLITAQDENTVKQVGEGLANKNLIDLVKAGEDVTLSNLHLSKNNVLTGTVASSGSNNPIYVTVTVGGVSTNVPVVGNYTVYTNTNGTVTSNNVDYAAETAPTGGNFSIDLSKLASSLTDDAQVAVTATKDFVEAAQTESVAALRALNTTTLQELVDDAPTEEAKSSYYNAPAEAQKAYTDAISTGKTILANPNNYDQVDVDNAVTAIQTAQNALTGKETNKTKLQAAIDQASTVESSINYTNADSNLQKAYTDAISAGQTVLSNDNATQTEVDNALTTINNAKDALNGDAKKAASKEALQKAVDEAPTVKSDDAAYYNGSDEAKAAYDKAISAGQAVLDNSNATATQITDALNAINTAKGNLKGEATDKTALETAVNNSKTVKDSNNYINADETQKTAYDNAVTAAQTVLNKTNATQAEVNQALQDLETANNNLNGDAKTEAANKAALEAAVKDAPNVRNTPAYYNGSEEAQTAYNNAINAGQAVLNQANPSASEVKNALDAINAAKDNLKGEATNTEALETALTNANNAKQTGNYTNADQENQEALNNAITVGQEILKNTKATQADVDNAAKVITDAINGLNGDTNLANAKNAATEDIQKALDTKTTEITDATNIDQATKDQLIADAKKAAEDANTAINQATNANAVNTAKTEGITKINNVKIPSLDDAKTNAAKEIDQALTDKTKEITDAENIDQTTKDQLIKEATDAATTAKDAIEKSTTNDEATKAGQAGVDAINNVKVPSVTDSQNAAKEAIDNALNAKTKEINDANNINQTTKDQLIKAATDAANNAKEAIDQATTADAIKTAQDEGTTNINNVTVPSLEDAKKAANKAVDDALTAQAEVINKANNLSDAEKKDLIDQATAEANKAKENIETATTNNEAAQAGQDGVDAIKKIVPTSLDTVKSDANKAIDDALTKKLEEINSANDLTTDERNALTQEANTAADKAKEEITKATTNAAVIEAQNTGVTVINDIKIPTESTVKETAKKAVADAVTAKNNAIDSSNLTAEEKAALKQAVTDAQNVADQAIDNATTNAAVTEAQTNGVNAINGIKVPTESTAKEAAKKAVAEAAEAKNNAIDSSNLTAEEKAALKQAVTDAQNVADQAIDNATTNAAVTEAQTNGVNAINGIKVPTESAVKEAAKKAVVDAATAKNNAIDSSNLTAEEKAALKQKVTEAQNAADQAIDNATSNAAVTEAQNSGVNAIDGIKVPTTSTTKEQAITDFNKAVDEAKKAIDQDNNLTNEEKQTVKDQIDSDAKNAQDTINNAKTNDDVKKAAADGTLAIDKDVANAAIDNAVAGKKEEISNSSLTDEEKTALNNEVDQKAQDAKEAINNATTPEAVTTAQENGIKNINETSVPTQSVAKETAKKAVADAADAKNVAIDSSNLTDEEKAALKQKVTEAQNAADQAIDKATTNAAVTEAQTNGVNAINGIKVPTESTAKEAAKKAVADAATAKNTAIDSSNLTDEEKAALKQKVTDAQTAADQAIDKATSNAAVTEAQTNGVNAIDGIKVPTESTAKEAAKKAVAEAAEAKNNAIDSSNLTDEEKAALKQKVTEAQNSADQAIDKATSNAAVTEAQTNGVNAINGIKVPTESTVKEAAKKAVADAATAKNTAIDASNLTDEEKAALKQKVTDAQTAADQAIDKATSNAAVTEAQTNGVNAINGIKVPTESTVKEAAKKAVADAATAKNTAIDASNLTAEEKAALKKEVTEAQNTADRAIDAATTNTAVTKAQDKGVKAIDNVTVPTESTAKEAAKKAIAEAAEAKNNAIDSSNLTDEEKAALKQEVTDAQNAANTAIDNATTNAAVTEAEDNGIKAINGIEIPTKSPAKDQATTDLNTAVENAKKAIDQDNNLTDEEKQAAKDQIDSDAKKAQEAINNAKTDDDVKKAADAGTLTIDKDVANAAIDNAVAGKKAEIAKAPLTTDEAKALNDLVDQEAKAAKKAIDSATTIPAVDDAKNTGVAAINDIAVPTTSLTKDQANQTIDDALANKIKEINDATNLSDKQKQDLIDQANEEAVKAKENIKNATSNEAVNKATTDGVDAIANVTVPSLDDAKKDASQLIDDVLKQKEDEINNASHLTNQEKQDLIHQAQNAADEAKDKINQATTNDDVATERDAGAEKIANIVVPSLEDAKDKATKAIDDALADKTKEINDQTHLSDQEKKDLINQITDIADKAKDKINNDSNDAEVAKDEKDGIDAIVDTKVPGLEDRKQNAIKSLDEAKSTKLAQIDEATHLTADEKANLTQQVDAEYNKALDNINKATTNDDADKASADGVEAILNIAVPSLNEKKQDSIDALNEVRDAKKEEINNANNLNQDEKDELTKQVDQIADNAINAINGAKDDQTAKNAENKGIQDILDVKVPSLDEVKTNAKQAIADALESKTNEINAASNLDSATKQELINRANAEADTAIEKIDQATSNDQALAASQAGIDKILGIEVPTLADAKQSAIDAINDALKQKEAEINNASQLTSDEKQNLINQVNSIADNAKNAINNATTNQSVEETKNAGIEKINAINVPTISATKDEAIKAIDNALTNKVNEINNATNITADEKANLIDEANNAANTAKDNITKATSDSEVATATTDGINAIANVTVPSLETAKDQAKNLIDDVLNEKKNEINNADNLSDSQKQDLINQATDEADQAKKNIDNATTNNDVQTAEDNGAQAIENVTVPSLDEAKKASTKVIDEVLKEKTAEINAATNLSNTEKDALIKDATTAANTAKDNIAKATTNDAVKDAETDGVKAILDIKVPGREDQQKDAIAALDRALADKVSEIDNANNLSETTKQDLKQQAQAAYTTAVDNVNNAQTSAEINAARDNGVQAILDITVPTLTDAQDASITAVEQVRDAKKTQIEAAKNLTETQKEALKNQVDEIADKAIDNIKNATTDATVKDAETAGINEILNVTIPTLDAAKSDAKQAIADALTAKTAEINAAQNLTDAEKQKLIDQAQTEAAAANKNIDAATTNDAAELAAKNGVQAILDIQVPTVEETRDQAKKNVDNALNSKKEEINNSNLSPAAKEALINEAEQAAENARTAIDNATTASAIGEAEAAGIAAIENIKVSNASTESDNSSNHQTNTETPTEGNSASQDNNNATQAPVQGNNTQADLAGSHGTNLTIGQQTEKAADTNSKETLPQTGNETERGLSIAGLAIASLLGLFGLSGLGKKRD